MTERDVFEAGGVPDDIGWMPLTNLRWSKDGKLQQLWAHPDSSQYREWRDVPTEGQPE